MSGPRDPRPSRGAATTRGRFIVLEGVDGAGTTTQARRLESWLRIEGRAVHLSREPSNGPIGSLIRQILTGRLVAGASDDAPASQVRGETVALLYAADRLDHIQAEVEPVLDRGIHVVSDRYVLSSFAYQSRDCPLEWVRSLNRYAPEPDLTILLRVPPDVALERIARTRSRRERFEQATVLEHVASTYDELVAELPAERRLVLDGENTPDAIAERIRTRVASLLQG